MIETQRMRLRPIEMEDATDIQEIFDHPRFYYLDAEYAGHNATKFLEKYMGLHNEDPTNGAILIHMSAVLKSQNKVVGVFSFGNDHLLSRLSEHGAEITGFLNPHFWGLRLPLEAVKAYMPIYAKTFDCHSFYATVDPTNKSSIAVIKYFNFKKIDEIRAPMEVKLYNGIRDVYGLTLPS